jgi:hypothetical protein
MRLYNFEAIRDYRNSRMDTIININDFMVILVPCCCFAINFCFPLFLAIDANTQPNFLYNNLCIICLESSDD